MHEWSRFYFQSCVPLLPFTTSSGVQPPSSAFVLLFVFFFRSCLGVTHPYESSRRRFPFNFNFIFISMLLFYFCRFDRKKKTKNKNRMKCVILRFLLLHLRVQPTHRSKAKRFWIIDKVSFAILFLRREFNTPVRMCASVLSSSTHFYCISFCFRRFSLVSFILLECKRQRKCLLSCHLILSLSIDELNPGNKVLASNKKNNFVNLYSPSALTCQCKTESWISINRNANANYSKSLWRNYLTAHHRHTTAKINRTKFEERKKYIEKYC